MYLNFFFFFYFIIEFQILCIFLYLWFYKKYNLGEHNLVTSFKNILRNLTDPKFMNGSKYSTVV